MTVLIFIVTFFFISNWFQLLIILSAVFGGKIEKKPVKDKWVYETIFKKTGLKLQEITLYKDKRMYGMMMGLPFWPKMVLSEGLYKTLNRDELEWVLLHEAGHCVLWHNLEATLIEFSLASLGVYLITTNNLGFAASFALSVLLALICIQIIRWLIEYQADNYSISRVTNPKGVITAQDKFRNSKHTWIFSSEKSLGRLLLHWNIMPSKRIEMAKVRLSSFQPRGKIYS